MNDQPDISLYGDVALSQSYRIMSLGDREPGSSTYGCFDRNYWHYRLIDFPNARAQEAVLYLALLYGYNHPDNRFYKQDIVLNWSKAAMVFWGDHLNPDGSTNEWWPLERSFCATTFSTFAMAETCHLLDWTPPGDGLARAARWLDAHENRKVLNQLAGSTCALLLSSIALNDDSLRNAASKKMDILLEMQDAEGYFTEYGGWDVGYLTITLSCLAKYYQLTQEDRVLDAANRAFRFLDDKIEANGTFDYTIGSRNTQYFYPYAFFALQEHELLERHLNGLRKNEVINPAWHDDRYCLPLAIDYLQTAMLQAST